MHRRSTSNGASLEMCDKHIAEIPMKFYSILALLNGIAFIAGRFQLAPLFWTFLLVAFSITLNRLRRIDYDNYSGISLAVLSAAVMYLLFSKAGMTWDVASFEFPKYYDLLAGTKGPFWTYALLPAVFYGSSLPLGLMGVAVIYSYSLALFSLSICELIQVGGGRNRLMKIALLVILLLSLFNAIFHIGKGDILAASFLNIASTCAVSLCIPVSSRIQKDHLCLCEIDPRGSVAIILLYSLLAFISKTGTAIVAVPLLFIGLLGFFLRLRSLGHTASLTNTLKLLLAAAFLSLAASLLIYLNEFHIHGLPGVVDLAIVESGKNNSFAFSMSRFFENSIRPLSLQNAVKSLASLSIAVAAALVIIVGLARKMRDSHYGLAEKILVGCLAGALTISIIYMPFAALHPLGIGPGFSTENLRLISQPALALMILSLA